MKKLIVLFISLLMTLSLVSSVSAGDYRQEEIKEDEIIYKSDSQELNIQTSENMFPTTNIIEVAGSTITITLPEGVTYDGYEQKSFTADSSEYAVPNYDVEVDYNSSSRTITYKNTEPGILTFRIKTKKNGKNYNAGIYVYFGNVESTNGMNYIIQKRFEFYKTQFGTGAHFIGAGLVNEGKVQWYTYTLCETLELEYSKDGNSWSKVAEDNNVWGAALYSAPYISKYLETAGGGNYRLKATVDVNGTKVTTYSENVAVAGPNTSIPTNPGSSEELEPEVVYMKKKIGTDVVTEMQYTFISKIENDEVVALQLENEEKQDGNVISLNENGKHLITVYTKNDTIIRWRVTVSEIGSKMATTDTTPTTPPTTTNETKPEESTTTTEPSISPTTNGLDLSPYSNFSMNVYPGSRVTDMKGTENGFSLKGYMFEDGANCEKSLWREIIFVNSEDSSPEKAYRKQVTPVYNTWLNKNMTATHNGTYKLDYANYEINVDISNMQNYKKTATGKMASGTYLVYMRISNGKTSYLFPLVDKELSDGSTMESKGTLPSSFTVTDPESRVLAYTVK